MDTNQIAVDALRAQQWNRLVELGIDAVEPLIDTMLSTTEQNVRQKAFESLVQVGNPSIGPLVTSLRGEINARALVAKALGHIGGPKVVDPLLDALLDDNWGVRAASAQSLGQFIEKRVEKALRRVIEEDLNTYPIEAARKSLQLIRHARKNQMEPIITALKDDETKNTAIKILAQLGDTRVAEPLIKELFLQAERQNPVMAKDLENVFGDYAEMSVNAAGGYTWSITTFRPKGDQYSRYSYDLSLMESAVKRLCEIRSPISSNILHLVASRHDITVIDIDVHNLPNTSYRILDVTAVRHLARVALLERELPPYNPVAYLDPCAWKL